MQNEVMRVKGMGVRICSVLFLATKVKGVYMRVGSGNRAELSLRKRMGSLQHVLLGVVVALALVALIGCAGLVSGANTTSGPPPPSTLDITNVQVACATTSTCQIICTTNL